MKKIMFICIFFIALLFSCCSKKNISIANNNVSDILKNDDVIITESESKIIKTNVIRKGMPTIPLTLKYKTSGIKVLRYGSDEYDVLLDEVLYFYVTENEEYYLGKVDRTGVYDKNDIPLFLTSESYVKGGYVDAIILEYPSHISYLWFEYDEKYVYRHIGEVHISFEPVILLDFDLESMTLTKFIPNI